MTDTVDIVDYDGNRTPIAADVIEGRAHQRVKVQFGTDGEARDVSEADPLPSADAATAAAVAAVQGAVEAVETALGATLTTALPADAATSAKQDAMIEHLDDAAALLAAISGATDGIEALLATIDADTGHLADIRTAVQLLGNAISGTEMQVDVVTSPRNDLAGAVNLTNTTLTDVLSAQGSGVSIVVTSILVVNAHASVSTKVEISDGSTVKLRALAPAGGYGFAHRDERGLFVTGANTAVRARCVTTGADVDVSLAGYRVS